MLGYRFLLYAVALAIEQNQSCARDSETSTMTENLIFLRGDFQRKVWSRSVFQVTRHVFTVQCALRVPEIVTALLEAGADVETTDIMGNDPFMAACGMGRLDNVKMWFRKIQKLERQ